jgi:predicted short-subunit dehydrogenase-like oxidoreductase (DUF2520 family)
MAAMQAKTETTARRNRAAAKKPSREKKPASRPSKMTVSIIGAGRLGAALALALAARGYVIESIVARRKSNARRVARLINSLTTRPLSAAELDLVPASELIFITTPDDLITATAAQLARFLTGAGGQTALHMSGALSSTALQPLREVGFTIASLHPLVAITDPVSGAANLQRAFYCIEGERPGAARASEIVRSLGAQSFSIKTQEKALYHAAAVTASGQMIALFDIAAEMLAACGLTPEKARVILLPLVLSAVDNLAKREPSGALTGTFARADVSVVRQHLAALRRLNDHQRRDALDVYILLGMRSLRLAQKNGAPVAALREIARLLKEAKADA